MLHPAVTAGFIGVAFLSVLAAVRPSGKRWITFLLWGSLLLFSVAVMLEDVYPLFEEISYLASGLLIVGHLFNRRQAKSGVLAPEPKVKAIA